MVEILRLVAVCGVYFSIPRNFCGLVFDIYDHLN